MSGRPKLGALAVRNITRRPIETLTLVLGGLLGTAVIVAAFVVGDSFGDSIRAVALTDLGPIDQTVQLQAGVEDPGKVMAELEDHIRHDPPAGTDGLMSVTVGQVVVSNGRDGSARSVIPSACAAEMDLAEGRRFGGEPAQTGLSDAGSNLTGDDVLVNRRAANHLGVETGDDLVLLASGGRRAMHVRAVLPTVGLAGRCELIVPRGTLGEMAAARPGDAPPALAPVRQLWVSNTGDVFGGADRSDQVTEDLKQLVATDRFVQGRAEVRPVKADLLDASQRQGSSLRSIFSGIGGFSVLAAVLLLVNLFVMLGEERKVTLGVMRAVGTKRRHVWAAFVEEGLAYIVGSTLLGVAAGVAVSAAVVSATSSIFSERDDDFAIALSVRPGSLAVAAAIGAGIALLTICFTSIRIARFNVIAAIRDLPNPPGDASHPVRRAVCLVAAAAGVATVIVGPDVTLLAGVPVAAAALVQLLPHGASVRFRRAVVGAAGAVAVGWPLGAFALFPDRLERPGIAVFVVMGVVMVGGAVTIAVSADGVLRWLTAHHGGSRRGLALRLGLSHPLDQRMRTGLLCGMYSLIVFTMAFLACFTAILATQRSSAAAEMAAGSDLYVTSNRANPLSPDELLGVDGVAAATTTLRGAPEWTAARYADEPTRWPASGIDDSFVERGAPALVRRNPRFASDRDAFLALVADPSLVVVSDSFLQRGNGPRDVGPEVGDRVTLIEPTGPHHDLEVIGVLRSDFVRAGAFLARSSVERWLSTGASAAQAYVTVAPGRDASAVAAAVNERFVERGVEAHTFGEVVDDSLRATRGFIGLLEGYLAVGLLIGIAGLGVVMVRAVRERRREIAMARAMGMSSRTIRAAFFIESLSIAIVSISVGVALGLLTAWQVVVNSSAFSTATVRFVAPWGSLWWIVAAPLVGSILATLLPARRAARIRPAAALRSAD